MYHILKTCDPNTYEDAQGKYKWESAMVAEYDALMKDKTCDLVPQLQEKNVVNF